MSYEQDNRKVIKRFFNKRRGGILICDYTRFIAAWEGKKDIRPNQSHNFTSVANKVDTSSKVKSDPKNWEHKLLETILFADGRNENQFNLHTKTNQFFPCIKF